MISSAKSRCMTRNWTMRRQTRRRNCRSPRQAEEGFVMAKNAEKETALYEAVFRLLARGEKMYSVTVQQIAEEAGIGKGTVYEYFTSREEIISKAMAYRLRGEADALSERVNKAEGFEQKLDTLLCFARDSVQAQASGMKVLFASARTLESPEAVCSHIGDAQVVEQLRAMIARIVESGVREGLLRQPPSEAYALMALAGAVFGYANLQHILPGQDDAALREDARQMVRRALS
ncbi:MAG: TetR/AcrR family transcriptional regulator [Ruthenibacterium lactatiformans]|nr:TetR/AcrR family transcriptional regulator [Ruthenibacterium lactatiformans]